MVHGRLSSSPTPQPSGQMPSFETVAKSRRLSGGLWRVAEMYAATRRARLVGGAPHQGEDEDDEPDRATYRTRLRRLEARVRRAPERAREVRLSWSHHLPLSLIHISEPTRLG